MKFWLLLLLFVPFFTFAQDDQSLYSRKNTDHHEWSYSGNYGPNYWAELGEEFRSCSGSSQSPINIASGNVITANMNLRFHYNPFFVDLINNGHTLIERVVDFKALSFNEVDYTLLQFHFHTPSEHQLDGLEFPMEIHFVHQSSAGKYAVLGVFVEEGNYENPFLAHFMGNLPTKVNEEIRSKEKANPSECFPSNTESFYYYNGSLTTPPCTEGINWIILSDPVTATCEQIEKIHEIIKNDNRPIQPLKDRLVFYAN